MADVKSDYLVPQVVIDDIDGALKSLDRFKVKDKTFREEDEKPVPDEYFSRLRESLKQLPPHSVSQNMYPDGVLYQGYAWTQTDDMITITYTSPTDISADDIKIEGDTINTRTKFVNGKFWGDVLDCDIKVAGNKATIQLRVDGKWPALIVGGDMDPESLYQLAVIAQQFQYQDIFDRLLLHCAMQYHNFALSTLAIHFNTLEDHEAAFYFYVLYATHSHELVPLILLSEYLLVDSTNILCLQLAENILVQLAKQGVGVAFRYLGMLHLGESPGFNADRTLAVRYFTTAGEEHHDLKSIEVLGKCYIAGIGCSPDVEKGCALLEVAGLTAEEILEQTSAHETPTDKSPHSVVDYVITGAIVASAAVLGLMAFKRFRRH